MSRAGLTDKKDKNEKVRYSDVPMSSYYTFSPHRNLDIGINGFGYVRFNCRTKDDVDGHFVHLIGKRSIGEAANISGVMAHITRFSIGKCISP